jgi:hypothetical protein
MPVTVGVKPKGIQKARLVLRGMTPAETPEIVSRAMRESMDLVRTTARDRFMSGPHGRSRIDELSGRLKASLVTDDSRLPFSIRMGSPLVYGAVHEYADGGARSYLRRALRASSREIRAKFKASWEKALAELVG